MLQGILVCIRKNGGNNERRSGFSLQVCGEVGKGNGKAFCEGEGRPRCLNMKDFYLVTFKADNNIVCQRSPWLHAPMSHIQIIIYASIGKNLAVTHLMAAPVLFPEGIARSVAEGNGRCLAGKLDGVGDQGEAAVFGVIF